MRLDEPPPLPTVPGGVRVALRRLDTDPGVRVLGWIIAALIAAALMVLIGRGGSKPADPVLQGATTTAPLSRIPGFGTARVHVTNGTSPRDLCVAVAATEATRRQGMMQRTDFAGYDGMLFAFPSDTTNSFYMRATPLPLSIAWFDHDGGFVGVADMEPCPDRAGCPTFDPGRPYRTALEVPQGRLAALGIGPGSSIALGGACA